MKMFCYSRILFFVPFIILFCDINQVLCETSRKLSHLVNPYCNSTCGNLIMIKAEGPADVLYYVWDFDSKPTLTMFALPPHSNMSVDWDNYEKHKQKSISFTSWPFYIFGVMINNIYEFNDQDDSGILHSDAAQNIKMPSQYFNWSIGGFLDDIPSNSILYYLSADGYQHENITKTGVINITASVFGNDGHSEELPHLLHTENSSQVDLVIDNLTTSYDRSRFAIEYVTFGLNDENSKVRLSAKKTLDDENTPGVFILDTLRVGNDNDINQAHSGYLQWLPIVYTSSNKVVSNSTKTFEYDIVNATRSLSDTVLNSSLLLDLRGFPIKVVSANISFGWSGDGFYRRTNYSSWSFLIGIGSSPEPEFSMMVFLIIAIGLGFPTLIILGGTAFMIYRKVRYGD
ncbi:glycosylated lysosomal membrane protein-like [Planococcus citri]|uniref:glycosylated lysosomal membrane protein-like n=1 Tax=Planococcus citri TaxID=170843 RepID=UPI0031F7A9F5